MRGKVLKRECLNCRINVGRFATNLLKNLAQIVIAPVIALSIAIFVAACKNNLNSTELFACFAVAYRSDALYTILGVGSFLLWERLASRSSNESCLSDKAYLFGIKIVSVTFIVLLGAAVYYRFVPSAVLSRSIFALDYIEVFTLGLCVVLQCISAPNNYLVLES